MFFFAKCGDCCRQGIIINIAEIHSTAFLFFLMFQTMAEVREENSYYPQLLWKGLELGLKTVRSSTPRTRIHGDKT